MAKKQFKAESKRLLDLMINSIYTHKEIFLREIISNASDACDKLCYQALTDDSVKLTRKDFKIDLSVNKDARTITVTDNGIGMDKEDLENNLGVIASSGSYKFKQEVGDDTKDTDVIGQFGVGFYSAFMVCDQVTVRTRKFGSDTAYQWQSSGADGYTVTECDKSDAGTEVIMHLKDDTEDEHYSEFLEEWKLRELIKKYSDYIRFPIRMAVTKTKKVASCMSDKPDEVPYVEMETLNSMVPIWQRKKADVKPEEYNEFYREKFHDFADPQRVITVSAEGAVTYKALLFIPGTTPFDFYTKEYEKGLQLYSSGVLIMDKCPDLLPEHFRFVRGVVDSPDLSLNISRELLQHDRQLKVIAGNLEKKIKQELSRLQEQEREKYEKFYEAFGLQLKYGVVADFGQHKELLQDLLLAVKVHHIEARQRLRLHLRPEKAQLEKLQRQLILRQLRIGRVLLCRDRHIEHRHPHERLRSHALRLQPRIAVGHKFLRPAQTRNAEPARQIIKLPDALDHHADEPRIGPVRRLRRRA